ncbi:MAG: 5-deoxy-glucuronate isomerase [Patescibacteria group bacterium]
MYPWNNEARLDTLKAWGENEILHVEAGAEKAEIHLENGEISKVIFKHGDEEHVIEKKDAKTITVGENNWERTVLHFLKPGGPAPSLRLGITHHNGLGTWSSLPHGFEENLEPGFEEVFFYLLEGGPKKAFQVGRGVFHDMTPVDNIWPVTDRSWSCIPMGYHPVVGEPHVRVSYVWAYLVKQPHWEKI